MTISLPSISDFTSKQARSTRWKPPVFALVLWSPCIYVFIYIYVCMYIIRYSLITIPPTKHSLMTIIDESVLLWICEEYPDNFSSISLCRHYDHPTTSADFRNTSHSSLPRSRKKQKCEKWFLFTQLCAWCSRFESYDGIHAKQKYHHLLHDTKICVQQCTWWYDWTSGHAAASE